MRRPSALPVHSHQIGRGSTLRITVTDDPNHIALVDVHYEGSVARAAGVMAQNWDDALARHEWTVDVPEVAEYRPGFFFERELPSILAVLERAPTEPRLIVVDGYVVLDAHGRPGLGAHVFGHFAGRIPVVGIAKRSFAGGDFAIRILRGSSENALFITALGMPDLEAAEHVKRMHGPHRIPTLCTRVDHLCRGLAKARLGP
jgi:deoxyribonuclease V